MNSFDAGLLRFINQYAHHSRIFDVAVSTLTYRNFFKAGLILVFWWVWFRPDATRTRNREIVVATFASACTAVIIGRLLAALLPFRVRPIQTPSLEFILPYGITTDALRNWSSFPSDHAMVFFALAAGLWFVSRVLGALMSVYVLLLIALPRVYMGLHYPTDIAGGAVLGILFACVANLQLVRPRLAAPALQWEHWHPQSFYPFFFLFSEGLGAMFDFIRRGANLVFQGA